MENYIKFSEKEAKYFGDIFLYLDKVGSGKIPVKEVQEFLSISRLPTEILSKVLILSGDITHGFYSRHQVFVALKLVAIAQQGLPLVANSVLTTVEVPLPRLYTSNNLIFGCSSKASSYSAQENGASSPDLIQLSDSDCNSSNVIDEGYRMMISEEGEEDNLDNAGEPSAWKTPHTPSPASDSPTPTNSVNEKNWKKSPGQWRGLNEFVNDEHCQLLGTEDDSSDHQSSDEEDEDVWTITEEQLQYYTEQFKVLQPNLNDKVSGTLAKDFFEKSKLPVAELSRIWQLSDTTRDGALSLQEFYIAMHLVVLRKNNIEIPDTLPPSLMPYSVQNLEDTNERVSKNESFEKDFVSHKSEEYAGCGSLSDVLSNSCNEKENSPVNETGISSPLPTSPQSKEWTKFIDSPTSTVSSPGPKPVNFDFQKSAVEQDPKILHPKPLRLTPETKVLENSANNRSFSPEPPPELIAQPVMKNSLPSPNKSIADSSEHCYIQRPTPRKPSGYQYGPNSLPLLSNVSSLKKEVPPPPPPRPQRTHARSSSLDLNKFGQSGGLIAPPAVPPRSSPNANALRKSSQDKSEETFLSEEAEIINEADMENLPRSSAFEIYRKPFKASDEQTITCADDLTSTVEEHNSKTSKLRDKKEIQAAIRNIKEKNKILLRLNSDLNQEYAEVMEERIGLELQLEQMLL